MTPRPGAVQSTGLILATILAAAGLNLGVMSLGQADDGGTDVDTAAVPTSTEAGLQALNDTAPAGVDPGAITMVPAAAPTASDPAITASALPAGTGATPGPPVAAATSSSLSPAAPGTAAASTASAGTATSQPTTVTSRPTTQAPATIPLGTVTTAKPTTISTATALSTTTTTRASQSTNYDHTVTGAGALTVSVTHNRLGLVSVSDVSGWSHTVDTSRAELVKVVFIRRGSEVTVSVTLRNGVPNFTEERSNND